MIGLGRNCVVCRLSLPQFHGGSKVLRRFYKEEFRRPIWKRRRVLGSAIIENKDFDISSSSKLTMLPPVPGPLQQTIWRSFTFVGMGIHSGEISCVRIRPAFAGDGRYFVRVPSGTISEYTLPYEETEIDLESYAETNLDVDAEVLRSELFLKYLDYCETEGFIGQFGDFLEHYMRKKGLEVELYKKDKKREKPTRKSSSEKVISATLDHAVRDENPYQTTLENLDGDRVESVEYLLAALEACGIDNARIEVEGYGEIPMTDGSAYTWTSEIQRVGVAVALGEKDDDDIFMHAARKPDEIIHVHNNDAFICLMPSDKMELTYGIDHSEEAAVIGRQWFTWCVQKDAHSFGNMLAPAKRYSTSKNKVQEWVRDDYFKGVNEDVVNIAEGDKWYKGADLKYPEDEAARHKLLELLGDLSLLGNNGMSGIPFGHIIAYKADHSLHMTFAKKLLNGFSDSYVSFLPDTSSFPSSEQANNLETNHENTGFET